MLILKGIFIGEIKCRNCGFLWIITKIEKIEIDKDVVDGVVSVHSDGKQLSP